jgi:DNA mismatch repair protein MutS
VSLTPMMQQYLQVKEKCKDCILFFRLGDFYEMFFEDAETASRELELVLTGRDCGLENRAPMCGIPYHAANNYISRLINKGYKVAICEQMEDPSASKGIVKRDIAKIITPGTYLDSNTLDDNKNNFIASIYIDKSSQCCGLCFTDISTGEFYVTDFYYKLSLLMDELAKFNPKEIIIEEDTDHDILATIVERFKLSITKKHIDFFTEKELYTLVDQFKDIELSEYSSYLVNASQGMLNYIFETQKQTLSNITSIQYYSVDNYMNMDINTRRNLELTETLRDKTKKGSLLWVLDKTVTAMGGRMLRKWVEQPLINKKEITDRLNSIDELTSNINLLQDLKDALKGIYDIERIIGKISSRSVNAKELLSLKHSIEKIPLVKNIIKSCTSRQLENLQISLDSLGDLQLLLESCIHNNPSLSLKEGNIIKDGYNEEIDSLRQAKAHGKEWIAALENQERDVTGIKSLKIGYNKVFGYYIEISRANYTSIPEGRYIRKQTLANAERFITSELKEMEDKVLGAEEKLISLEYKIFLEIRDTIESHIERMKKTAHILSELDSLCSLSTSALDNNYVKPNINTEGYMNIENGRHPVVEKVIPSGTFVSNNTYLNNSTDQLLIITGPNMAGKSTYMRQVALIGLMAQIGSFVPASKADICICDRIFTRIGASDDLSAGKSTFMVEMWEVANILSNATNNSLVLLDEVGRGTSTYDGLSIAWAVIEYICTNIKLKCKTLFATHYHELTKLEDSIPGVKNYCVSITEIDNNIVFLRKIIPGGADQSYGIEVAKLAGLPKELIERAKDLLSALEKDPSNEIAFTSQYTNTTKSMKVSDQVTKYENNSVQLDFTELEKINLLKEIASIDIMNLTPMESMNKLYDVIKKAKSFT